MDDFDETILRLTDQVSQFKSQNTEKCSSGINIPKLNLSSPVIYYSIVPVVIFTGLYMIKPSFIMKKIQDTDDDKKERQINYKILLLTTLILSTICIVGFLYLIPMYNKRKKLFP